MAAKTFFFDPINLFTVLSIFSLLRLCISLSPHLHSSVLQKIVTNIDSNPNYKNVQIDHNKISDFVFSHSDSSFDHIIKNSARCKNGHFNHNFDSATAINKSDKGNDFDFHNFDGDIHFTLNDFDIESVEVLDKNMHHLRCEINAHEEIEKILDSYIKDVSSPFYRQLKRWNFLPEKSVYHIGNSTHAIISFLCVEGHRINTWDELHLRTHVDVMDNGELKFHEKMQACECTPKSCKEYIINYFHAIGADIVNPDVRLHAEKTVCSESAGGNRYGFGEAEILQDDVQCKHSNMELEEDVVVSKCAFLTKPKCVFLDDVEKEIKKVSHWPFIGVVSFLLGANVFILMI